MHALPTGTVTFLFTDIEGSTKLWQDHPEQMQPALARHDQLLRQVIAENGGYVFKTVGDAFCAAFATAPDALAGALAAQMALAGEAWELPAPLLVRTALHTGAAEERDGDYFGQTLNRVARLMAAGHGGQTLLSRATQELTRDFLPSGVSLLDLGERRLKDLARPEHVFQILHPSLPADFPPLRSLDNPDLPNNLPQQVTSFVGREKESAEVRALLDKTRLLTLTGPGGAGKSRLSLQVAADLLTGEGDGVWLVELAALSDPALVPQAVADVLGVREEAGRPLIRSLVDALKAKRILLVLDNCEHLVFACASLAADLLRACPGVHLLASSREPLHVTGETVYRLPSLSLPDPQQAQTADSLSQYEAVRLFIERAQAVQPSFTVTDANAPAVAQVCFQLDGIPLAIELAAARVRSLPVEEVNARLGDRFKLLTGGSRVALPRQQTLRALVDWSFDLLSEQEKALLCHLSVFAGGWTLDAAEEICAGSEFEGWEIEDWEVLDLLTSLVDKSLAIYVEAENGPGRYRLLETIRRYADERLILAGKKEAVRGRHLDWFFALAQEAEALLEGPDLGMWVTRLSADLDNLRAALDFGLGGAALDTALAIRVIRAVAALRVFWRVRAMPREGHSYAAAVLECNAEARGSEEMKDQLSVLALLYSYDGDQATAAALMEERLAWCRANGRYMESIHTLFNYATVLDRMGDAAGSRRLSEECLAEIELAAVSVEADAGALRKYRLGVEGNLAVGYWDAGEYGRAFALLSKNIPVFRDLHNAEWLTQCLVSVGALLLKPWEGRDLAQAEGYLREGLELSAAHGNRMQMLDGLSDFAALRAQQAHWTLAVRLHAASDSSRQELGVTPSPQQKEEHEALVSGARAFLEPPEFDAAWEAGRAMTLEQAADHALSAAA